MDLALIRGFRIAAEIIIVLSLVSAVVECLVVSLGLSTVSGLLHYLAATTVSAFIGGVMWWHFGRRHKILLEKMRPPVASSQPDTKTPDGKMSREEFVATLARLVGAERIDEDAVPHVGNMMQLNVIAAFHFKMMFVSSVQPTVGKLVDNLYRQYLRQ